MLVEREIVRPGGAVTFWRLEKTGLEAAQEALKPCGVTVKAPQPSAALRTAMEGLFPKLLIRPLAGQSGYCVVEEKKGSRDNAYGTLGSAWFGDPQNPVYPGEAPIEVDGALSFYSTNAAYHAERQKATPVEIAEALKNYVLSRSGIPLRDMGGVYWMPPDSVGGWRKVADALDACRGGTIYNVTINADTDSAAALNVLVRDHLVDEAKRIVAEHRSADLGKRALQARIEALDGMVKNTRGYEQVLEDSLADLRAAITSAKIELTDALVALQTADRREARKREQERMAA